MENEFNARISHKFKGNMNMHKENVMQNLDYDKIETEKENFKICFLFPSKTEENAEIRKDIKAILAGALREQVEHRTH